MRSRIPFDVNAPYLFYHSLWPPFSLSVCCPFLLIITFCTPPLLTSCPFTRFYDPLCRFCPPACCLLCPRLSPYSFNAISQITSRSSRSPAKSISTTSQERPKSADKMFTPPPAPSKPPIPSHPPGHPSRPMRPLPKLWPVGRMVHLLKTP